MKKVKTRAVQMGKKTWTLSSKHWMEAMRSTGGRAPMEAPRGAHP